MFDGSVQLSQFVDRYRQLVYGDGQGDALLAWTSQNWLCHQKRAIAREVFINNRRYQFRIAVSGDFDEVDIVFRKRDRAVGDSNASSGWLLHRKYDSRAASA